MADKKTYYWLKLRKEFLEGDTIDYIMGQNAGCGAEYVLLYEMLCMMCINTDGIMATQIGHIYVPFDIGKIQRQCKYFDADTIMVALTLFRNLDLIRERPDGIMYITNFEELVGKETQEAVYKRNQRKRKAAEQVECSYEPPAQLTMEDASALDEDIGQDTEEAEDEYAEDGIVAVEGSCDYQTDDNSTYEYQTADNDKYELSDNSKSVLCQTIQTKTCDISDSNNIDESSGSSAESDENVDFTSTSADVHKSVDIVQTNVHTEIRDKSIDNNLSNTDVFDCPTFLKKQKVRRPRDADVVSTKWNNEIAVLGIAKVNRITNDSQRYKLLKKRIHDYGLETVLSAMDRIKCSDFLLGKKSDFMITFDWFIRPNNFIKVRDGNYDNRPAPDTRGRPNNNWDSGNRSESYKQLGEDFERQVLAN